MHDLVYIAAPYTNADAAIVDTRMECVYSAMAFFAKEKNMHVVTPLAMHELVKRLPMPTDYEYWQTYCTNLLSRCDKMIVLKLDGWCDSLGVAGEIKFCEENNIPVEYWEI